MTLQNERENMISELLERFASACGCGENGYHSDDACDRYERKLVTWTFEQLAEMINNY